MFKRGKKDRGRERWDDGESESDSECILICRKYKEQRHTTVEYPTYLQHTKLISRLVLVKLDSIERHYKTQTEYKI